MIDILPPLPSVELAPTPESRLTTLLEELSHHAMDATVRDIVLALTDLIETKIREARDGVKISNIPPVVAKTVTVVQLREVAAKPNDQRVLFEFIPYDGDVLPENFPRYQGITKGRVKIGKYNVDTQPIPFVFNAPSAADAWANYDKIASAARKPVEYAVKKELLMHPERLPKQ